MAIFLTPSNSALISWHNFIKGLSFISHLFSHVFNCISIHLQILFYSLGYKSLLSVFILILTLTQIWLVGAPSSWFLYFLLCFYNFLSTSLLSVTRYSRSSLSQPWNQLFLQGSLVWYVIIRHNIQKIWAIVVFIVTGISLLLGPFSLQIQKTPPPPPPPNSYLSLYSIPLIPILHNRVHPKLPYHVCNNCLSQ